MFFTFGGNLQKSTSKWSLQIKLPYKVHIHDILECNLFPKVLSDVLFVYYTQRYFQNYYT